MATPRGRPPRVFISHRGMDRRGCSVKEEFAIPLHEELEKAGFKSFLDKRCMHPGRVGQEEIMENLRSCDRVVVILSRGFFESRYCMEEVHEAILRGKGVAWPVFYDLEPGEVLELAKAASEEETCEWPESERSQWLTSLQTLREVAGLRRSELGGSNDHLKKEVAEILCKQCGVVLLPCSGERVVHGLVPLGGQVLGRAEDVKWIESVLERDADSPQYVCLVGISGIGKTTLAQDYAISHKLEYEMIQLISGGRQGAIEEGLQAMAVWLGIEDWEISDVVAGARQSGRDPNEAVLVVIRQVLEKRGPLLLVLDDVWEDLQEVYDILRKTLPATGLTHVMLTMPDMAVASRANWLSCREIQSLSEEDAVTLASGGMTWEGEEQAALHRLCGDMEFHTLALSVAGSVLGGAIPPVKPSIFRLRLMREGSLPRYFGARDPQNAREVHFGTLFSATEKMMSEDIASEEAKSLALHVARLAGWLSPDPIRLELLVGSSDADLSNEAMGLLWRYGLAKLDGLHLTFHELVQNYERVQGGRESGAYAVEAVMRFGDVEKDVTHYTVLCQRVFQGFGDKIQTMPLALDGDRHVPFCEGVVQPLVGHYMGSWQYTLAVELATSGLASFGDGLFDKAGGVEAACELGAVKGMALSEMGRKEAALAEQRALLEVQRRVLGEEHPHIMLSRSWLACSLVDMGRNEEALAEGRAVLEVQRRVLGEEHPDTLISRSNLASTLRDMGRNEEALAEERAVLGEEHPDTLISRSNRDAPGHGAQ